MIAAVCIDDRGGMLFNGRRVSRDEAQRADLLAFCGEKTLRMNDRSAALFTEHRDRVAVSGDFLSAAGEGEICFVEDAPLRPHLAKLEGLLLYRWNRAYPSDVKLDIDPAAEGFVLTQVTEFPGTSHKTITRETYQRETRRD